MKKVYNFLVWIQWLAIRINFFQNIIFQNSVNVENLLQVYQKTFKKLLLFNCQTLFVLELKNYVPSNLIGSGDSICNS